jgi:hypothetical protein
VPAQQGNHEGLPLLFEKIPSTSRRSALVNGQALRQRVESIQTRLTPSFVEAQVRELLRQGEDVGGGVNAIRLVKYLVGDVGRGDVEATWAYDQLKPGLRAALEEIPALYYFEGD